jgi:hypothetical protein
LGIYNDTKYHAKANQEEYTMSAFIILYAAIGIALMARMTFVMAKYNGQRKWLWAVLTVLFGAIPMAYVFWSRPKED